jgi:hypothetical protein
MGASDVQILPETWNANGELASPIGTHVEWNWDNSHIIDTDDFPGVAAEAWDVLVERWPDEFIDVTDAKRIPRSAWEEQWQAYATGGTPNYVGAPPAGSTEADAEAASAAAAEDLELDEGEATDEETPKRGRKR